MIFTIHLWQYKGGSFIGFAPSGAVKSKGKSDRNSQVFPQTISTKAMNFRSNPRGNHVQFKSHLDFLEPGSIALGPPGRCIAAWNATFLFLAWRWTHIDCKHMMKTYTWDFYAAKAAKRFELCFSFSIPHLGRMGRSCWSTVPSPVTTSELSGGAATPTRVGLHLVYQCISPVILCNCDNTPNHFGDIFLYIHTHTHIYIYT